MSAEEVEALVSGELLGDPHLRVDRVAPLDEADGRAISFVAAVRYLPYLAATQAGLLLIPGEWRDHIPDGRAAILVKDPHVALRAVLLAMYPAPRVEAGVHATAVVDSTAAIDPTAAIGAFAVVGPRSRVGRRCVLGSHVAVGADCSLGEEVVIHPHATLYDGVTIRDRAVVHSGARIGKEGFGFVWQDGGHRKIPQIGGCIIGEDVEIGANVCVDRGSVGDTVIAAGTKIDNLVQLGHNVRLGKHVIAVSQVGISGSTSIGDGSILGGQAGVGGHLTIGAGARIGAQAGVTADVPPGETYSGYPARPHREALRVQAATFRLPDLLRRLKRLEAAAPRDENR